MNPYESETKAFGIRRQLPQEIETGAVSRSRFESTIAAGAYGRPAVDVDVVVGEVMPLGF